MWVLAGLQAVAQGLATWSGRRATGPIKGMSKWGMARWDSGELINGTRHVRSAPLQVCAVTE